MSSPPLFFHHPFKKDDRRPKPTHTGTKGGRTKHCADSFSSYYGKKKAELHDLSIKLDLFSEVFVEHFAGAENVGFDSSYRKP